MIKPATHYVHRSWTGAVFVKEAAFFAEQGGLTEAWGKAWVPVQATSIEHARQQGALYRKSMERTATNDPLE